MKFNSIINDVCCDSRIKDGVLRLEVPEHVFVLQEYLEKAGFSLETIVNNTAKLFEAGKFPERQAYNKDGILVTFPSKEYRDRAVDKGTHFAENPKKNVGTLFSPTDAGGLSTADIEKTDSEEEKQDSDKSDTVSLDQELDKKITGDDKKDDRTSKEKSQDAVAVNAILNDAPLINQQIDECEDCGCNECDKDEYTIEEAIKCGFVKNGFNWYKLDGKLIGEQVYKESAGPVIISEKSSCNAQKMEFYIADELNNRPSGDKTAALIAAKLSKIDGIKTCDALGDKTCPITNPLFTQLNSTSKTDLIFGGKKRMRASLKATGAQICSAQNAEVNSVVSAILEDSGEDKVLMEQVSSFILNGIEKKFYVGLQDSVKEQLHKSLTAVIRGASVEDIKDDIQNVENIIKQNKSFVKKGQIPIDMTKTLETLNSVFVNPERRYMLIEELATGKRRFAQGKANFRADCIADHMMTWDCSGNYHIYTVTKFIKDNDNNIKFRFSNRGGVRGISIRGDIKLEEIQLDEGLMDTIKSAGTYISNYFGDVWKDIQSLTGKAKEFFTKAWESVKAGLQSIYEDILKLGRYMKSIIQEGWMKFTEILGIQGEADGAWTWEMPTQSTPDVMPVEPTST